MCDYDTVICEKYVNIRNERACDGCGEISAIGSKLLRTVGKFEGEFYTSYACPTCEFCANQPEDSALHVCFGSQWDIFVGDIFEYVRNKLSAGGIPSEQEFDLVKAGER